MVDPIVSEPLPSKFKYDVKKALLIGCSKYDKIRPDGGFNLPTVTEDIRIMNTCLTLMGYDVTILNDPTKRQIDGYLSKLEVDFDPGQTDRKLLFKCYASSHGLIRLGTTHMYLNERDNLFYPIEYNLRKLKKNRNIYCIGILDMCRSADFVDPLHPLQSRDLSDQQTEY